MLRRGTASIVPQGGLEEKLAKSAKTGKPLIIKLGLDPTAPDIHLGFAVVLRKLRQFQNLGHQVVIIIGDYTALIGDPSGRSATRPMLTEEEIRANGSTYVDQLSSILDPKRTTVRFNGEWLGKLSFADLVRLTSRMTVAQVLEREDFAKRFAANQPISLHELLYPLAQAYDSVAIEADVEMGGQDQTFNILAGRDLQKQAGQDQQIGLFMPLLVGLDGEKKMSKSLGNYVGITEPPNDMYGKVMSIGDAQMRMYFELCTDADMTEVDRLLAQAASGELNPKEVKRRLATEIVTIYHGAEAAMAANDEFERVHAQRSLPDEIPDAQLPGDIVEDGAVWIPKLLVANGLAKGTGDARRLIEQGAVKFHFVGAAEPTVVASVDEKIPVSNLAAGTVLQVGKRNFVRF